MVAEGKIKSKDLTYEASLPPFLQRLHAQKAGRGDPDKHETQFARPKRAKDDDAEDGPTVIDESGENVSKEDLEKLQNGTEGEDDTKISELVRGETLDEGEPKASGAIQEVDPKDRRRAEQKVTDGKATKKRKLVKAVGEATTDGEHEKAETGQGAKKAKKKAKPIKLAFDEGDG